MRKLKKVRLFFDDSYRQNKKYAYRAYYADAHKESDAYDHVELERNFSEARGEIPFTFVLLKHCEAIAEDLGGDCGHTNFCYQTNSATWRRSFSWW